MKQISPHNSTRAPTLVTGNDGKASNRFDAEVSGWQMTKHSFSTQSNLRTSNPAHCNISALQRKTYHCHRASTQSTAQQNLIISQSLDFIRKVRFYFLKRCSSKRTIYIGRKSKIFLFFWPTIKILTASKRISRKLTLSNEIGKEIHRVRAKF